MLLLHRPGPLSLSFSLTWVNGWAGPRRAVRPPSIMSYRHFTSSSRRPPPSPPCPYSHCMCPIGVSAKLGRKGWATELERGRGASSLLCFPRYPRPQQPATSTRFWPGCSPLGGRSRCGEGERVK
ncbi:hypothetical protein GGS23DRAFT_543486 [Durotheca rogersii]|uniref:uncharacterized protein n=1 Tax=Durotheca rogersii TaxID=419775 RepID=UPI002220A68A|nr:uncharacterized protein GGS23DRAFT_543486 [Durotheca rogersii]KAI5867987.1 hypothetical protein GGS23DRAFT_543486 [Durotheca rogersii]